MLAAFRWNLRVLSYVALLVGGFLIYNTISVSVVRRRPEIGIVRALGASRRSVLAAFLAEAACFGFAGAVLGCALGRVLATGALKLLSATVQALYVSSRPGAIELTPASLVIALLIGVGMSVIAALPPASEAARVSPMEAMSRGQREYATRVHQGRDMLIALGLAAGGIICAVPPAIAGKPLFGYLSAILLIAASALAIPAVADGLLHTSAHGLQKIIGVEGLLASRSLIGSLRRTSVLVGALSTAIAMMTSVGIMVGSFRQTVTTWMNDQLQADLYLRPAGNPASDQHPTIPNELADQLAKLPGVAGLDRFRAYEFSYEGLPATLGAADFHAVQPFRKSAFLSGRSASGVYSDLQGNDAVVVSEPFAHKHHLRRGDSITLPLGDRRVPFHIVDVSYDYASEAGYVVMDRATLLQYLPDPDPSNLAIYVAPGFDLETVRARHPDFFQSQFARRSDSHFRPHLRHYLRSRGNFYRRGRNGNCRSVARAGRRSPPRIWVTAVSGRRNFTDSKTDSGRSGADWSAGESGRIRFGSRAFFHLDLRNQQAVVWLDHPVPLARRDSGQFAGRRVSGYDPRRPVSCAHRDSPQSH